MNERIRELAINSGLLDAKYSPDFQSIYNSQLEKFAELIVQECVDAISEIDADYAVIYQTHILEHFGVDESDWFDEDPPC